MTMLFTDGFDVGDFALKYEFSIVAGGTTAATRFGTGLAYTYTSNGGTAGVLKKFFTASNKIIFGCAFKTVLNNDTSTVMQVWGDGGVTQHLGLRFLTTGQVVLVRGSTVIATSVASGLVTVNTWAYWEMSATIHDTTGSVEVRINGTPVISFTGDTKNAGTATTIDAISWHQSGVTSATPSIDDLYILNDLGSTNNNFLGDIRIQTLVPDGAGSVTQLSPLGVANNWDNVNEVPSSGADFNYSGTVGHRDLYSMTNLTAGTTVVFAVVPHIIARKTDSGVIAAKTALKHGATVATGTTQTLGTSSDVYATVHEINPSTGVAWTVGDLASLEAGVEVA